MVICSGCTRFYSSITPLRVGKDTLSLPVLGCLPRPRKRPGGSMRKFPTFSFRPSRRQVLYFASSSSFSFLMIAFSSLVNFFFSSLLVSKYSHIGLKSHFSNLLISGAYPINSNFRFEESTTLSSLRISNQSLKKFC